MRTARKNARLPRFSRPGPPRRVFPPYRRVFSALRFFLDCAGISGHYRRRKSLPDQGRFMRFDIKKVSISVPWAYLCVTEHDRSVWSWAEPGLTLRSVRPHGKDSAGDRRSVLLRLRGIRFCRELQRRDGGKPARPRPHVDFKRVSDAGAGVLRSRVTKKHNGHVAFHDMPVFLLSARSGFPCPRHSLTTAAPMMRTAPIHPAVPIASRRKNAEHRTDTTGSR